MDRRRILIVGGTGGVGKRLSLASARLGHPTFVLVRNLSPSDPDKAAVIKSLTGKGVTLVKGDLKNFASLILAVQKVDIVISAVGRSQILDQLTLLEAIIFVGTIERFIPSEFGNTVTEKSLPILHASYLDNKARVRRAIEKSGVPYTYVICGAGASWYLVNLWQDSLLAPPREKVTIWGDGNTKCVMIDDDDIGTFTILAVDDPRTENKFLHLRLEGVHKTQHELVEIWEEKIGRRLQKTYVPAEKLLKIIDESEYPGNLFVAIKYSYLVEGYRAQLGDNEVEASALYPDVKYTTCSEYLDRFL